MKNRTSMIIEDLEGNEHVVQLNVTGYGIDISVDGKIIGNVDVGSGFPRFVADLVNSGGIVTVDFLPEGLTIVAPDEIVRIGIGPRGTIFKETK